MEASGDERRYSGELGLNDLYIIKKLKENNIHFEKLETNHVEEAIGDVRHHAWCRSILFKEGQVVIIDISFTKAEGTLYQVVLLLLWGEIGQQVHVIVVHRGIGGVQDAVSFELDSTTFES